MSVPLEKGRSGKWQYHPRSDHHSKVACWGILFDLLLTSSLLRRHVADGRVIFGINHEMRDFRSARKKDLDLVIATPGAGECRNPKTFVDLVEKWDIQLLPRERELLRGLPPLHEASVGSVHIALEAKACMTEHGKARSRLYDELNSSHDSVHGAAEMAIAAGYVIVNAAEGFVSPMLNKNWRRASRITQHSQPEVTHAVIAKVLEIPRRTRTGTPGFDALGVSVVDCRNDGSPVRIVDGPPALPPGEPFHYDSMIARVAQLYESRFPHV
jgi:hypothetical protein